MTGVDHRPAEPQAGRGGHDDARQLEHAVRGDEVDESDPVSCFDHQSSDHADQEPVEEERERSEDPRGDAAGEHEQRHLDVVREDRGRELRLFAARHLAPRVTRLGRLPELPGHDPDCRTRIVNGPYGTKRRCTEE